MEDVVSGADLTFWEEEFCRDFALTLKAGNIYLSNKGLLSIFFYSSDLVPISISLTWFRLSCGFEQERPLIHAHISQKADTYFHWFPDMKPVSDTI